MLKIECDRLDSSFKLCAHCTLFLLPNLKSSSTSRGLDTSKEYRFSATNCSFFDHLILSPFIALVSRLFAALAGFIPEALAGFKRSNTFSL